MSDPKEETQEETKDLFHKDLDLVFSDQGWLKIKDAEEPSWRHQGPLATSVSWADYQALLDAYTALLSAYTNLLHQGEEGANGDP